MNKTGLTRFLVTRFLQSERSDRFLSAATVVAILAIAFGVAALFLSLGVISGFQETYKKSLLQFNSHLVLTKADEIDDPETLIRRLIPESDRDRILGWNPFIYREGMLISGREIRGIVIKGVDLEKFGNLSRMAIQLKPRFAETGLASFRQTPLLLLGKDLAAQLGGEPEQVKVLFPQRGRNLGTPRRFRVAGTFASGLYEYDASFAFLPLEDAQRFFQMGKKVSGIEIWLKDPEEAPAWAERLKKQFDFPYVVLSWRDINENLFRALETEKLVFFILMTVLIAVATLSVLASVIMLLIEKRSQIAVLRVMGLAWPRVRKIFLLDGLLIGFVGLVLGFLLALGAFVILQRWQPIPLAPEVYFISRIPVHTSWVHFFSVAGAALFLVWAGCLLTLKGVSRFPVLRTLVEG